VNDAQNPYIKEVKLYVDDAGEWRFTAYARNGEAIVVSSEGYTQKDDAVSAIVGVFGPDAPIVHD